MPCPVATRRAAILRLCALSATALATPWPAHALCASPAEGGRWRNVDPKGDPAVLDVRMIDCGDQVLNGEQTDTRFRLRVWVPQSTGSLYGRPSVAANVRSWQGKRWMVGRVPTGGYVDNVWMNAVQSNGERRLHVLIKHESLDSKPSSTSEHWFRFEKRL
jgi:hypothetical protein